MEHFAQIVKFHNYQVIIELSINVTRPNLMYHKYGPTLIDTIVTHTHVMLCERDAQISDDNEDNNESAQTQEICVCPQPI